MEETLINQRKLADSFFRNFNCNPMILFVGKSIHQEALKLIASYPWSCVITTKTDLAFSGYFAKEGTRTPKEYTSRSEIPAKPLNRGNLPILRLLGVDGYSHNNSEDSNGFLASLGLTLDVGKEVDLSRAQEMLQLLPRLLDCISKMVVVGYQPGVEGELPLNVFARTLMEIPNGNVQFWDMEPSGLPYEQLHQIALRKEFLFTENRLADVVRNRSEDKEPITLQISDDRYYLNEMPVSIQSEQLTRYGYLAKLLTERTVRGIRPNGTLQCEKWFSNFLLLSASDGPQWYGYLHNSTFYVKRRYEDILVQLTRQMLSSGNFQDQSSNGPIVLHGPSGSSKSITLGALAYRIYNEQLCPVIFIRNDNLLFYSGSQELEDLDNLMQFIERRDIANPRILLVWDCASYRSGINNARKLVRQLQNRGRRFVLVCSAYSGPEESECKEYFRMERSGESVRFRNCNIEKAQVIRSGQYFYVKASRELDKQEIDNLRGRFKEFSGIEPSLLKRWFDKLEKETCDIFDYFYRLIALLRPKLEEGLFREQRKVAQYVNEHLAKILGDQVMQPANSMRQAFLDAGFHPEEIPVEADNEKKDTDFIDALNRFNLCVAMFSQFKLDVPSNLAFSVLMGDNRSVYNVQLLQFITAIPWLYYGAGQKAGDFVFRFRTPIEAEIFLKEKGCTGEKQVDLLCEIIDLYGRNYQNSYCLDDELAGGLQDLLRLMGPNSRYLPYRQSQSSHGEVLRCLEPLINKVWDIWEKYDVPDRDAGFASIAITFTREFYGKQWDDTYYRANRQDTSQKPWEVDSEKYTVESYQSRLNHLYNAQNLADHCVAELENMLRSGDSQYTQQHLAEQKDMLIVEIAQCNSLAERLVGEYRELCGNETPEDAQYHDQRIRRYPEIFRLLVQVIHHQPDNGYAYNAVFKSFCEAYEREGRKEKKLQYLSEIMQIVDMCSNIEILNRGANGQDEISKNIATIQAISNAFRITIDEIKSRSSASQNAYYTLYDRLLEAGNPAAITLICQKELERAGIIFRSTTHLDSHQVIACKKVRSFMRESSNFECICGNSYALALLIRVSWMCYNKTALLGSTECQLTELDREEWDDIYRLCHMYCERTDAVGRQPIIVLLYALAEIHISWNYQQAIWILDTLGEGQFYTSERMRTPFLLCDEVGNPLRFGGTVISTKDRTGFIRVNGVPERLGGKTGIRFYCGNLGRSIRMPEKNDVLVDLELGIGYTGLSIYKAEGSLERRERI